MSLPPYSDPKSGIIAYSTMYEWVHIVGGTNIASYHDCRQLAKKLEKIIQDISLENNVPSF